MTASEEINFIVYSLISNSIHIINGQSIKMIHFCLSIIIKAQRIALLRACKFLIWVPFKCTYHLLGPLSNLYMKTVTQVKSSEYFESLVIGSFQEELFMAKLNDSHESSLRRLNDTHREKIALLDRQFLQQKQQLVSGLWSLRLKV
jgi:hypothetical protein